MKKELGIFILLIVLCVIVSVVNPNFLLANNLQNLARNTHHEFRLRFFNFRPRLDATYHSRAESRASQ